MLAGTVCLQEMQLLPRRDHELFRTSAFVCLTFAAAAGVWLCWLQLTSVTLRHSALYMTCTTTSWCMCCPAVLAEQTMLHAVLCVVCCSRDKLPCRVQVRVGQKRPAGDEQLPSTPAGNLRFTAHAYCRSSYCSASAVALLQQPQLASACMQRQWHLHEALNQTTTTGLASPY